MILSFIKPRFLKTNKARYEYSLYIIFWKKKSSSKILCDWYMQTRISTILILQSSILETFNRAASWENQQCGFRTGQTQAGLYKHRWPEAGNFGLRKKRNCTICVVKTKALNSFAATVKLVCTFVFALCKMMVLPWCGSIIFNKQVTFFISLNTCISALRAN